MLYFLHWLVALFTRTRFSTKKPRQGQFDIYQDRANAYRFRLKAAKGEIILLSEGYTAKASAKKGIASVKTHARFDHCYERKNAKGNRPMFNLKAANHEVIGTSEQYDSNAERDQCITWVKRYAPCAEIVDLA